MTESGEFESGSPYTALARKAIEAWVKERRELSTEEIKEEKKLLPEKAAAFVCLKKEGGLRGCIGTFQPTREDLAEEIVSNAISAACRDPRFPPVSEEELEDLDISVDVLGEPERVRDASQLDPRRYGVIVRRENRTGLLLPDLEGVDSVEEQLEIARNKAGISPREPIQVYRFTVERYH
ncbi:MAG: AmmeMemoRadiSam system protein A [Actinobacteria bacterium]|jgi:AmmeMemoRadiSam system protein A|nr:MAG: AmmeMemoRadiSam system protein A [Actinomycetota bacterium]